MNYDDWKTSPPEDDDCEDIICQNNKCKWTGPADELVRDEFGDRHCPDCEGDDLITKADQYERARYQYYQDKLDERRGK